MLNDHLWNRLWLFCPSQKKVPPHLLDEQPNMEGARAAWRPVICSFLPPSPHPSYPVSCHGEQVPESPCQCHQPGRPSVPVGVAGRGPASSTCPGSPTHETLLAHPPATAITRKQAGFLGLNTDQHHPIAPVFRDPHSPGTYHTL